MADDDIFFADVQEDPIEHEDIVSGESIEFFSPSERAQADRITKDNTVMSRCLAYVARSTGQSRESLYETVDQWTLKDLVKFSAVMVTLGVSHAIEDKLGFPVRDEVDRMLDCDLHVLKASLTMQRSSSEDIVTDGTLADLLRLKRGARLVEEGGRIFYRVPHAPEVEIHTEGPLRGRVKSGGNAFVVWLNVTMAKQYRYVVISPNAVIHAFLLLTKEKPTVTTTPDGRGKLSFQAVKDDGIPRGYATPSSQVLSYISAIRTALVAGFDNKTTSPSVGIRANRLAWVEHYLNQRYSTFNEKNVASLDALTKKITSEAEVEWKKVKAKCVVKPQDFAQTPMVPGTEEPVKTYGKVLKHVQVSRQNIRMRVDVPRKHDAPGLAFVADGASSVPSKYGPVVSALASLHPNAKCVAFGTGQGNWWHHLVSGGFKEVEWRDSDPRLAPPLGGYFVPGDVLKQAPGWAVGRVLLDDTLPDVKGNYLFDARIKAHIDSGAVGGSIKLYLGSTDMEDLPIGMVPPAILRLKEKFPIVEFFPGGSPHSPEFIVGYSSSTLGWSSPKPIYGRGKWGTPSSDDWGVYARSWFKVKSLETVRANYAQNAQVRMGFYCGALEPLFVYPEPEQILLAGDDGARALTNDAAAQDYGPPDIEDDGDYFDAPPTSTPGALGRGK